MKTLHVNIANKKAVYCRRGGDIVCGNSNYQIKFTFDAEWDAFSTKTARFVSNGEFTDVDFTGDTVAVPIMHNTEVLKVGVYAGDLRTTSPALIPCLRSILCLTDTPSVENDKSWANEAKEAAERAAEDARDEVTRLVGEIGVVQSKGTSPTAVMSQKAITENLDALLEAFEMTEGGHNLLDPANTESGVYSGVTSNNPTKVPADNHCRSASLIPLPTGANTLYLSTNLDTSSWDDPDPCVQLYFIDENGLFVKYDRKNIANFPETATIPTGATQLLLSTNGDTSKSGYLKGDMFCVSAESAEFEEYGAKTIPTKLKEDLVPQSVLDDIDECKKALSGDDASVRYNALEATASGEVVQITDASPINHKVKCKFNAINKSIPILDKIAPMSSKDVVTVDDSIIKISATGGAYGFNVTGVSFKVGKTYTFSIGSISEHGTAWGWKIKYADGTAVSQEYPYYNKWTVEITKEVTSILYYVGYPYTGNNDVYITYPRIEEGELTDYRVSRSKNLIPFPYAFGDSATKNGVTATVQADGGIILNGTATADAFFTLSERPVDAKHMVVAGTQYNAINYSSSRKFVANSSVGNDVKLSRWDVYANENSFTYLRLTSGNKFENEVVYPQIEVGQTSTSYEKGDTLTLLTIDENGYAEIEASPYMAIWAPDGTPVEVEYHRDINAEIANLKPNARLEEYGLPILYLEGDTMAMSKDIEVSLSYKYGERNGTCSLKWQGASSISWPKKNYTIKFDNKFEAKEGWGQQKKYCLKANYVDASHARNIVCAKIWADFVKSRATPNEKLLSLPNCGAIDGFPIIIVLNGEFHGLYTFNIPKDGWTYGMGGGAKEAAICAEGVKTHISQGHDGREITSFKQLAELDECDFSLEYCPDEDNTEWIKTSINRLIGAVMNSDGTDIDTTIAQYVDLESAIDYYIFTVFIKGFDNVTRNYVLTTYDGVKWIFNGYDMDSTFGLEPNTGFLANEEWNTSFGQVAYIHRLFGLLATHKKDAIKARYWQLRHLGTTADTGALASDVPMLKVIQFISSIPQGVYNEDWNKWRGIKYTSTNNYAQISEFMLKRLKYMDESIEQL